MMTKPNREKWHRRRNEIVDVSAKLLARRGYDGTGMTELCDAVGLGRGALYYYIESKENLLGLIHDRVMDELQDGISRNDFSHASPVVHLTALGMDLIRIITRYPDHVWVFLHEFRSLAGSHAEHFQERRRQYEDLIAAVLQRGADEGCFEIDDVRLATLYWLGLHNYIYIWFDKKGPYSPEYIAEEFTKMMLVGLQAKSHRRRSAGSGARADTRSGAAQPRSSRAVV